MSGIKGYYGGHFYVQGLNGIGHYNSTKEENTRVFINYLSYLCSLFKECGHRFIPSYLVDEDEIVREWFSVHYFFQSVDQPYHRIPETPSENCQVDFYSHICNTYLYKAGYLLFELLHTHRDKKQWISFSDGEWISPNIYDFEQRIYKVCLVVKKVSPDSPFRKIYILCKKEKGYPWIEVAHVEDPWIKGKEEPGWWHSLCECKSKPFPKLKHICIKKTLDEDIDRSRLPGCLQKEINHMCRKWYPTHALSTISNVL